MTNRPASWSIRTHLVILLVLLALPYALVTVYSGLKERDEAIEEAKRERLRFVDAVATEQQSLAAGAEQLANALALLPEVRSRDAKERVPFSPTWSRRILNMPIFSWLTGQVPCGHRQCLLRE